MIKPEDCIPIYPTKPTTRLEKLREEKDKAFGEIFFLTNGLEEADKFVKEVLLEKIKLKYREILVIQTEIENEIKAIKGGEDGLATEKSDRAKE